MSTTLSGRDELRTVSSVRLADWLQLGRWQNRLVWFVLLLGPAWAVDRSLFLWAHQKHVRGAFAGFRSASRPIGEPIGIAYVTIAVWVLDRWRRRPLVLLLVAVLAAGGVAAGLKLLLGRERPIVSGGRTVWRGPQRPGASKDDPSFPSGHTAAAFALAYGLSRLFPRGRPVFLFLAMACAASRALSGQHYLSDVLAGGWLGWEMAGLVWNSGRMHAFSNWLPEFSWYPRWQGPSVVAPGEALVRSTEGV